GRAPPRSRARSRLDGRQGRDHLQRGGTPRPRRPPRVGARADAPGPGARVAPRATGPVAAALRRLPRQRRRRRQPGRRREPPEGGRLMLDHGIGALRDAHAEGWALGAFSVYNLEGAQAVCAAAELEHAPVIVQAGSSAFAYAGRRALAGLALGAAADSTARVGVHLDHARELEEIRDCLELGYSSVMVDGS